ncbi:MAG: hypothetical protein M3461_22425 [Pseudomonadota bacterium]|nr:hypothetical protein [Pseudomonadota bacterium]
MANNIPPSNVFKFVALRPPTPPEKRNAQIAFIADTRPAKETPVGRLASHFDPEDGSQVPELIKRFIDERRYDLEYPQSRGDTRLFNVEAAVKAIPPEQVSTQHLQAAAGKVLGQPVKAFYSARESQQLLHEIWDRYYAFLILGLSTPQNLEQLTRNLRVYHLLALLAKDFPVPDAETLQTILSAKPVIDKFFTSLPKPKVTSEPPKLEALPEAKIAQYKGLWSDLVDTHRALEEVRALKLTTEAKTTTEQVEVPNRMTGFAEKSQITRVNTLKRVNPASFEALRPATKRVLTELRIKQDDFSMPGTVGALTTRLERLNSALATIDDPRFLSFMPQEAKEIRGLSLLGDHLKGGILSSVLFPLFLGGGNVRGSIKPLGIGDLKVVKQKLKKYAAGEVAHIENVLRGEYKERKHRVLDRTEETLTIATETEEETTKDTQTTERFELKKESEKTIQEQMSVQAGVTVSGSYGMVTFGAHGDFAYSTSSQESSKSASNFAREVIDKSVSRIQKKTREERVTKTLHEVEELNTHGIDNKDKPDHVTGIYRWVDKYYEAQIYNYGKRMMFEFIIPEPAAFLEYAQTHQPKKDIVPPVPLSATLTHKDIREWNYQTYIRDYLVQGCSPPPPEYKLVTATMASEAKIENGTALAKSSKELVVPDGYTIGDLGFSMSAIYVLGGPQIRLSIGNDDGSFALTNNAAKRRQDAVVGSVYLGPYDGIVPVSINCYDVNSFFVNVTATCYRRWEKYETWQIQTFEKIVAAYQALQATYEQKIAAQKAQQGIVIHGQNPLINRETEKTELKKSCVKMLLDTWVFGSFDAMKQTKDNAPDFDIFDAVKEGKQVQFFEQAFEWENMTYLFYPYFWGRQNQWIHKVTTFDTDPVFTRFLQAGSARVVIPVHTAYNDAVMYFLENNGAIWSGGDAPLLNDPLFISLADELRNQTDDLGHATPEGDPWEVVLPTTLVYLQKDAELPTFP